jgi:hypothetical protein
LYRELFLAPDLKLLLDTIFYRKSLEVTLRLKPQNITYKDSASRYRLHGMKRFRIAAIALHGMERFRVAATALHGMREKIFRHCVSLKMTITLKTPSLPRNN